MFDNCGGSKGERMAMTAGHTGRTWPTLINAFSDPRIADEILWTRKKPAVCRLVMLKWRAAKAFAKPSVHTWKAAWWVHAIMQWHSQSVGWRCFLDGDCLDNGCKFIPSAASPLDLDWSCCQVRCQPSWSWRSLVFGWNWSFASFTIQPFNVPRDTAAFCPEKGEAAKL